MRYWDDAEIFGVARPIVISDELKRLAIMERAFGEAGQSRQTVWVGF